MISTSRSGQVVRHLLANVHQATIRLLLPAAIAPGTTVDTDEYDSDSRRKERGDQHRTVNHGRGEYARDDEGDSSHEVHVNTRDGCWSLWRTWLRTHRGQSLEKLSLYVGFFQFVHNARKRRKALLESLVARPSRIAG